MTNSSNNKKGRALALHEKLKGKIEIKNKIRLSPENFALLYTPGVSAATREIAKNPKKAWNLTIKSDSIAIISDGSRTIGVGDAVAEASLPVMEGKAMIFKEFADINAYPLCIDERNEIKLAGIIKSLSPTFGLFNLEDISAPRCFRIYDILKKDNLLFFHDDREGVGIVVLAGLMNALKVAGKNKRAKILIGGAGAAGLGIFEILLKAGFKNITVFDKNGILHRGRKENDEYSEFIARNSNRENAKGDFREALSGTDVFIGVTSVGNLLKIEDIKLMNGFPIIFALSNPAPEISYREISGYDSDFVYASGRSDFPNQINNALAFPFLIKAILRKNKPYTLAKGIKIAKAIAGLIKKPDKRSIIPNIFDKRIKKTILNNF